MRFRDKCRPLWVNKAYMIKIFFLGALFTVTTVSCSNNQCRNSHSTDVKSESRLDSTGGILKTSSVRQSFPKDKPGQSQELFHILKVSGLKLKKMNGGLGFRAYDVTCTTSGSSGDRQCVFLGDEPNRPKQRSYTVPEAETKNLSAILFDLPVAQGDSGAQTPYIECWADTDSRNATCSVAIDLDYRGP
jgi:hypothetical protein